MERNEWLEARKKGIGGTDIAAIFGLNRWKSPMHVYLDKIGAGETVEQNEAMYWGSKMERDLAERFDEEHPEFLLERNQESELSVHPDHPFIVGSFDGLVLSAYSGVDVNGKVLPPIAGWEAKTASAYKRSEWDGVDVPQEYWLQCQWYMGISGLPRWYLSVLIGGNDYREFVIERDDEAIEMLIRRAVEFWKLVEDRTPPPIDGSEASSNVLDSMFPAEDAVLDPPLDLGEGWSSVVLALLTARGERDKYQATMDTLENELKAQMGSHAVAITGKYEVDWKPRTRTSYNTRLLVEKHPEIASQIAKVTEYRVFSVKEPKEDSDE